MDDDAARRPASVRMRLARLAATVIADNGGAVAVADARWSSSDGDRRVSGVLAVEDGHGRVDLALHVSALWPPKPLDQLAGDLRADVGRAAAAADLQPRLGTVDVRVHDILDRATVA